VFVYFKVENEFKKFGGFQALQLKEASFDIMSRSFVRQNYDKNNECNVYVSSNGLS
jgi:hypothetical protein